MKKITKVIYSIIVLPFLAVIVNNPAPDFFVEKPGKDFNSIFLFFSNAILQLTGIVAVLFLVIGGFQYITSGANQEQAESGKKTVTNAIIGLVIVILSYIIVNAVINALKGQV